MTMLFMDGFDHYGVGGSGSIASLHMNDGLWTNANSVTIGTPAFGAATDLALNTKQGGTQRKVFDWGTRTAILVGCRIGLDTLPTSNLTRAICTFNDGSNNIKWRVYIRSTGDIALVEGSVANEENLHVLKKLRERAKILVSLGDCAGFGCVPMLRNQFSVQDVLERAYVEVESTAMGA